MLQPLVRPLTDSTDPYSNWSVLLGSRAVRVPLGEGAGLGGRLGGRLGGLGSGGGEVRQRDAVEDGDGLQLLFGRAAAQRAAGRGRAGPGLSVSGRHLEEQHRKGHGSGEVDLGGLSPHRTASQHHLKANVKQTRVLPLSVCTVAPAAAPPVLRRCCSAASPQPPQTAPPASSSGPA